jgi:class 3 adenylate cyclase/tetratricopeptide (TPR) repeat protein
MRCGSCGLESDTPRKFCGGCGAALPKRCAACGAESPAAFKFCGECGASLGDAPPRREPAASSSPARDPRAYTPKHLADKILASKSALEGERKQVTVLFADVKGSMELAESVDPEDWHRILERFFAILADGVHRFEGTVNQYTGDGIMALFGAPIAHEDHAQRACYAALHLREALRELARDVKRRHGLDFATRIGINSGEVVVGKIGDDLRMDYTAQGHTVGLAQRMEALASGGSIYLAAPTAALVQGYFALEDLGEFDVKGAAEPLRVFELQGTGAARTRFDLSRARGLTRFVGRKDEMALLEAALEQALTGSGRTVGVMALAGTGKSRLCYELVERCRARGLQVVEARGLSHGKQLPLVAALELMRSFFGIAEGDTDRAAREKIAGRVLLLDEALRDELPIFFDLLGVPDPARPLPALEPEALQRRMHNAVRAIARANGRVEAGVLLVEDLHWLDAASDGVLAQIIAGNAESRGLVLVNFRPEYRARWMGQSHYQQLSLLPLSEAALRELLRELLGGNASVAGLPDAIHARTGGNPFFIEEIVRSLVEDGSLAGARGAYRLTRPVASLPLPATVHSVLAARIDRLPERDKHVLQAASVIGKSFGERILSRVVELPAAELDEALRSLQDAEFLYETALYPEREYTFKHPLTQEVAEHTQLRERRVRAHAATARAIEALDVERLDERAALLAQHWEAADEPLIAARWHVRAAAWIGGSDLGEALAHWRRVRELCREGDRDEALALTAQSGSEIMMLAFQAGLADLSDVELRAVLADVRRASVGTADRQPLANALAWYGYLLMMSRSDVDPILAEALALAREIGNPGLEAGVLSVMTDTQYVRGDLHGALALTDRTMDAIGDERQTAVYFGRLEMIELTAAKRAVYFCDLGRHVEGRAALGRYEARVEQLGLSLENELMSLHFWLGFSQPLFGPTPDALQRARRFARLADESGRVEWIHRASHTVGNILQLLGQFEESIAWLERALAVQREQRVGAFYEGATLAGLADAHRACGRIEEARRLAQEAVAMAESTGTRAREIAAQLAFARVLIADGAGERDAIDAALARAEALVDETGARAHLPFVSEVRADLARARGDATEAASKLREAHSLFVEMGATGHAERLAKELAP